MELYILDHPFHYEMECMTMLFFPGEKVTLHHEGAPAGEERAIVTRVEDCRPVVEFCLGEGCRRFAGEPAPEGGKALEYSMAIAFFEGGCQVTGRQPPWGILTGIRPVKLLRARYEAGEGEAALRRYFEGECRVSRRKTDLALATMRGERAALERTGPGDYSLYISIPFCPSRCHFCSFVSHSIEKTHKLIEPYLDCLVRELAETARLADAAGLRLRTVYFGGGTPSILTPEQIRRLTGAVAQYFDLEGLWEYTFEAGRPDTIDGEKLAAVYEAGAGRISINPQSLCDAVLQASGRKHTAAQTVEKYFLARQFPFDSINMDVIAGLPEDTPARFAQTIDQIAALAPENVTVHTLSVKRSSSFNMQGVELYRRQIDEVAQMVDYAQQKLTGSGYLPYYLYRQRNTLANLENTGFARPGKEGLYNIYIMDETHTILSVGGGGVTKLKCCAKDRIERIFNFKYPYEYISRFDEILKRKQKVVDFFAENGY